MADRWTQDYIYNMIEQNTIIRPSMLVKDDMPKLMYVKAALAKRICASRFQSQTNRSLSFKAIGSSLRCLPTIFMVLTRFINRRAKTMQYLVKVDGGPGIEQQATAESVGIFFFRQAKEI